MNRGFASDNYAGIHPEILQAIADVNEGHATAYGDDEVTERLRKTFRKQFGAHTEVYPVFNGTGANVVALQAMCKRWEAVICAQSAHIHVDEGGAPEVMAGLKMWTVATPDGKLTPELIDQQAHGFGFVHRAQPKVVSIAQSTEQGTVYALHEIRAIADHVHSLGMWLHMDGARIANAAVRLGTELRALTSDVGVDVLSFGGTKNGLMLGEAVVVLNPEGAPGVDFLRKTSMQLASKMRFISAQLLALFNDELWRRNAMHANTMAALLEQRARAINGVTIPRRAQANAVFAILPKEVIPVLQEEFHFYVWDEFTGEVRWMCAWDTTADDVVEFTTAIARMLGQ